MKGPGRMRFRKAVAYVIAVCSLLGIGAIGFLNRTALAKEAHNWHILPQPERLTELYFTEPNQLPNGSSSEQMIAFTVRNLEYQTTTYTYTILAESEDEDEVEHVLGEGAFTLNQNQSGTTSKTVRLPSLSGRAKVVLFLTTKDLMPRVVSLPLTASQSIIGQTRLTQMMTRSNHEDARIPI